MGGGEQGARYGQNVRAPRIPQNVETGRNVRCVELEKTGLHGKARRQPPDLLHKRQKRLRRRRLTAAMTANQNTRPIIQRHCVDITIWPLYGNRAMLGITFREISRCKMFGKQVSLFRLYGFEVKFDLSWILLALLVTSSLAAGYFPEKVPGLSAGAYWMMGVLGAAGLFASIIFHEMCHSLVARAYGLPIRGITLFIFGGVAEMEDEPADARVEFLMAIAGPVSSYVLAFGFLLAGYLANAMGAPEAFRALTGYLYLINFMLATFNLLPAFPLDGGRMLRAILWRWNGSLRWATRHASRIGAGFGIGLIVLGVLQALRGNLAAGVWIGLIGLFLHGAANASYTQLRTRQALEGQPVRRFMSRDPVTAPPYLNLRELADDYVYVHGHDMYPVTEDGRLVGCVSLRQIKDTPQTQWQTTQVRQIMSPCSENNMIDADDDAIHAISVMQRGGNSRLMVIENGKLAGVVAMKDMLRLLALKLDLEA